MKQKRTRYNISLHPQVQGAAAKLATEKDMSLSRLIEKLLKREASKAGLLKREAL